MYIEHIAMYVNDLEKTKAFFEKYGKPTFVLTRAEDGVKQSRYTLGGQPLRPRPP